LSAAPRIALLLALAFSASFSRADEPAPAPTPIVPGLPLRVVAEVRERYDNPELPLDPNGDVDVRHGALPFFFSRIRLGVHFEPLPRFSAFAEAQDSRFWGEEQGTLGNLKGTDLHQGWLHLGDSERFARVGRQEYGLGEERLFGRDDWYETGRAFDMIRLRSPLQDGRFVGEILYAETTNPVPNNTDEAFELVALTRVLPREGYVRLFGVEKHESHQGPITGNKLYIGTVGAAAHLFVGDFLFDIEGAGQFGLRYDEGQRAGFVAGYVRRTFSGSHPTTVGLEGSWGSGDGDSTNRVNGKIDPLYPSRHGKYGFLDLLSLQNARQAAVTLDVKGERAGDSFRFAARWLGVDDPRDAWINSRGETVGRVPSGDAGRSIGWELDLGLARKIFREIDVVIALEGGYLVGGDFAKAAANVVQAYEGAITLTYRFGY
jgi:hypothetical protein